MFTNYTNPRKCVYSSMEKENNIKYEENISNMQKKEARKRTRN